MAEFWTPQAGGSWTECTGNLASLAADPLGAVNLQNVVIIRATAASLREVILVGAYTGLYRTVTAADGPAAIWERIGNLPHAIVQSIRYRPVHASHGRRRARGRLARPRHLGAH